MTGRPGANWCNRRMVLDPFAVVHHHVGDDDIVGFAFICREPIVAAGRHRYLVSGVFEPEADFLAKVYAVVDQEHRNHNYNMD